ncbi:LOW QUALITY PROTEIN: protein DGCR6-like [Patiria miniata]|uniref:Protein DGCR6 n=1 Tax=Patiria miniata TaxID=46514 RepID=A0A914AZ34_PATMI|nr:LOW QUALITY PROTEIN: protein DGCR6-like [Patiria miniata]
MSMYGAYPSGHDINTEIQQRQRQYALLMEIQRLCRELPMAYQQRMPYSMLSSLSASLLLDGTVFEIVNHLAEIQHMTERKLMEQRSTLVNTHKAMKQEMTKKHREALQSCQSKPHNLKLVTSTNEKEKQALEKRLQEEIRKCDERIVLELDHRVAEQQMTLGRQAGFFTTSNAGGRLQMCLLEIRKLSKMNFNAVPPASRDRPRLVDCDSSRDNSGACYSH